MSGRLTIVALLALAGCSHRPSVSPLATPRHARPQLFVYPTLAMPGRMLSASVLVPDPPTDLLCLTVTGPDGLEHRRSCAGVRLLGYTFAPSAPGRYQVVATLEHAGDRLQVAHKEVCVIGGEDADACDVGVAQR